METKILSGIIMMLLLISTTSAMTIYTNEYWNAGRSYVIEIKTDSKNTTMHLEVVDKEGNKIIGKKEPKLIQEGIYREKITIPVNA